MSAVDKCQLLCCVLLLCRKRDWCVAITSSLGGLSAMAMLCGNVRMWFVVCHSVQSVSLYL